MGVGSDLADRLESQRSDVATLFADVVRCPSVGPGDGLEHAFALLANYLADRGLRVDVARPSPDAPVLTAVLEGDDGGPSIMLQGHMDVVPAGEGWTRDPFVAEVDDEEILWGRGSCDMKAGIAAFAGVVTALHDAGGPARGRVTLLVDSDEETGSERGLLPFIDGGGIEGFDIAICAEPTALEPYLGNRGLIWATARFRGRAAHAGIPSPGINPVPAAADLVGRLRPPVPPASLPAGITPPSLTATMLTGSDTINIIPTEASVGLDRRLVPGDDPYRAVDELRSLVAAVAAAYEGVEGDLEIKKLWPPCSMAPTDALAVAALEAARAMRPDADFGFDDASNDASFLAAAGVPTLVWGPGAPEMAHTADERISLAEVHSATRLYADALVNLLGIGDTEAGMSA